MLILEEAKQEFLTQQIKKELDKLTHTDLQQLQTSIGRAETHNNSIQQWYLINIFNSRLKYQHGHPEPLLSLRFSLKSFRIDSEWPVFRLISF